MMFSAGDVDAAAVVVAAGLDGDAVVAGVENAILDQHVAARFRIAAVVVGAVAEDIHAADGDVGAENRIDLPHRRIVNGDAFDQHVLAAIRLDEVGPQKLAFAKYAFLDRLAALTHLI